MRTFQKEKNYYKNNRGSFWELENRIMGRKKRIKCGCLRARVCVGVGVVVFVYTAVDFGVHLRLKRAGERHACGLNNM